MKTYARRKQLLADLSDQPPKDLPSFRQLVLDEATQLTREIQKIEEDFYEGGSALAFIRRQAVRLREVLEAHKMSEISSLRQLEAVIRFARDPEVAEASEATKVRPGQISKDTADQLLVLQNRLLEFVPGRFSGLVQRIQSLSGHCERYLCAFYALDVDPAIETAKIYARNILMWGELIRKCVSHLYELPQLFLRGGLSLARIGDTAVDLLDRAGMLPCPILAIFPDCCDHLREASRLLGSWVERDAQYCDHLDNDLVEFEAAKKKKSRALKKAKHRSSMLQFRVKTLQSDRARLQVELESLLEKEADLTVEEEALYRDLNRNQVRNPFLLPFSSCDLVVQAALRQL